MPKGKKLTTNEFIERSKNIHKDRYNYSQSNYINNQTKINIICKKHGSFFQRPFCHLKGNGCPLCYNGKRSQNSRIDFDVFKNKANKIHKDKYKYIKINYEKRTTVIIICPTHGEFCQRMEAHLKGHGCRKCSYEKQRLGAKEFLKRANKIHKNKYKYELPDIVTSNSKIKIICKKHGSFYQLVLNHLLGKRECKKCFIDARKINKKIIKRNTVIFIKKAKLIHGNKYNYSKTIYLGYKNKIKIRCSIHGIFKQRADLHLDGYGCRKCAYKERGKKRRMSHSEFSKKAIKIHGNKYDYSEVVCMKLQTKVKIKCPEHGIFLQIAQHHLNGSGCQKCHIEKMKIKNTKGDLNSFLQKAKIIHKNKYDYSKTKYIGISSKICIICPKHGRFYPRAYSHLKGSGCKKCNYENVSMTDIDFIKKANIKHNNKYSYKLPKIIPIRSKVKIKCPVHGIFYQEAGSHVKLGYGCRQCTSKKLRKTLETFIKEAKNVHGDLYNYSFVDYKNGRTPVKIICKKHGMFEQRPWKHINGRHGCPECHFKAEGQLGVILRNIFPKWSIRHNVRVHNGVYKGISYNRTCDYLLKKDNTKIMVEHDGQQHFGPVRFSNSISKYKAKKAYERQQIVDKLDKEFCQENNILLHRVKYNEDKNMSVIKLKNKVLSL